MNCFILITVFSMWFYEDKQAYEPVRVQERYLNVKNIDEVLYNKTMKKVQLNLSGDKNYWTDLDLNTVMNKIKNCK